VRGIRGPNFRVIPHSQIKLQIAQIHEIERLFADQIKIDEKVCKCQIFEKLAGSGVWILIYSDKTVSNHMI